MPLKKFRVRRAGHFAPIQFGRLKSPGRLRVGNFFRLPAERGKLPASALANRLAQFLVMIGEIQKGSGRCPLLALEEQGRERRSEQDRGADFQQAKLQRLFMPAATDDLLDPFTACAVADLVVVLQAHHKAVAAQARWRTTMSPAAKARELPGINKGLLNGFA